MSNEESSPNPTEETKVPLPNLSGEKEIRQSQASPTEDQKKKLRIRVPVTGWKETQELIAQAEKLLSGRVVVYFVSEDSKITNEHIQYFYSQLRTLGKTENLYVILYSFGGHPALSERRSNNNDAVLLSFGHRQQSDPPAQPTGTKRRACFHLH